MKVNITYNMYKNNNFYLLGYISSGRIIKIFVFIFEHNLHINYVSSASPICNENRLLEYKSEIN